MTTADASTPDHEPLHEGEEAPPRGLLVMALLRWLILAGVAALAATAWWSFAHADPALAHAPRYQCPMHPQITASDPGECPICHMDLEPIDPARAHDHADADAAPSPAAPTVFACPMHPAQQSLSPGTCPICKMDLDPLPASKAPTVYRCPMHPAQQSLSPGTCPICKMDLEALRSPPPGTAPLRLSLDRQQSIGVRTAEARALTRTPTLRAPATLELAESGAAQVHVRAAGFLEKIAVAETGVRVHRGQRLADLYSPEIYQAQTELLAARRWADGNNALAAARARLELLGMSSAAIERLLATGKPSRTVAVEAPASGVIIARSAVLGAYVTPETALYELRDPDTFLVVAELPAGRGEAITAGTTAHLTIPTRPGYTRELRVDLVYPELDRDARSFRARLTLHDPSLRAGEYALVDFELAPVDVIAVPRDALVSTGASDHVFVDHGDGQLEPRAVTLGACWDELCAVTDVHAGERVVAGATFLVDAESRLRAALVPVP
ncbi:efflux RND transporter periplasmic adaptor subunit [Nannocystis sp.]|uniref:efflux RND transporter periplasmic adaptor subunit n=1 Tax=Nannocystis sp. TaxID=1962667 RepID=UPI0025E7FC04|nr:efflux RND transporter periplasmic adaptor subunit [Nannocystis sp.]MBK7829308.1 efflux RND transporter periplasmic adaptor subunit [Nannocystis sp.]